MNKKGFTLIEVISVIAILAILIIIVATASTGINKNAKEKIYAEKVQSIELSGTYWGQDNANLFKSKENCTTVPSNAAASTTNYKCYEGLTVQDLIDNNYLKPDNDEGIIADPRNETIKLNNKKVIIYYYNNNYYAEFDH